MQKAHFHRIDFSEEFNKIVKIILSLNFIEICLKFEINPYHIFFNQIWLGIYAINDYLRLCVLGVFNAY